MAKSEKAAFLEPHEPRPENIAEWLRGWGFDPARPYTETRDNDGWTWFFQEVPEGATTRE